MRVIQEELGVEESVEDEIQKWLMQLDELKLPEKIDEKIRKEIKRFSNMQASSAEGNVSRTYIETVLSLPWNVRDDNKLDLKKAEKILDENPPSFATIHPATGPFTIYLC